MTKSRIITVIPVYNGEAFILQTLQSIAEQTLRPDRVIVQDNCSTDNTERLVKEFKAINCEWRRNQENLGWIGNANRALELAPDTEYLHLICADDMVKPEYYATLTKALDDCRGYGLGYTLDERVDEHNKCLSVSGKITGQIEVQTKTDFLKEKAEVANQAFSSSLLKTSYLPPACRINPNFPSFADMVFWAEWGSHCDKIVRVNVPLTQFRWHGTNNSSIFMANLQSLVLDEWKGMQLIESWRGVPTGCVRRFKLKGLFGVRSGIKAKRFREQGNPSFSRQIVEASRPISGPLAWYMAQAIVHARDLIVYGLGRRKKHPKNVYG